MLLGLLAPTPGEVERPLQKGLGKCLRLAKERAASTPREWAHAPSAICLDSDEDADYGLELKQRPSQETSVSKQDPDVF